MKELAAMTGVSTRTLRYYDEIALLKPVDYTEAGYRLYNQQSVDRLQQILFYRELKMPLAKVAQAMTQSREQVFHEQRKALQQEHERLEKLLHVIDDALGENRMINEQKFAAFKQEKLAEQEQLYGVESRRKYGEEAIKASYTKYQDMTEEQYKEMQAVEALLIEALRQPSVDEAYVVALHKQWLLFTWVTYTPKMHKGLVEGYLADERFIAYYDRQAGQGATQKLYEAIQHYA
nr:MerR family transcriptional regulator [Lysinibacillus sp. BF-4]